MPSELYDDYMTTIERIPIWEQTMMATYLMNYWGMDHCVRPNNKKPGKKKHHPLSKVADCHPVTVHAQQPGNGGRDIDQPRLHMH
jgi:hypothetical protein